MVENIIVGKKEATKNKLVDNGTNPASLGANGNPAESGNATDESTNTDALAAKNKRRKTSQKALSSLFSARRLSSAARNIS